MIDDQLDSNTDQEQVVKVHEDQIQTNIFKKRFRKESDIQTDNIINPQKEVIVLN